MLKEAVIPIIASVLFDGVLDQGDVAISQLETEIRQSLDALPQSDGFNVTLIANNGRKFSHSVGDVSESTPLRSASTSKWVTASIILWLVQDDALSLSDHPQQYIDFWPTTGELSEITLLQLLSFTSGLNNDAVCIDIGGANFENCVRNVVQNNQVTPVLAGSEFYYTSSHMQVAGLMAVKALGVDSWQDVFERFKLATSLFSDSSYSLPSSQNPRLAGGMMWVASDYLEYLDKLYRQQILTGSLFELQKSDHTATAAMVNSPALDAVNQDWHYGLGVWLECVSVQYDCDDISRISSPGAYGAYPFIDFEYQYYGLVAREGELGSFDQGYAIWRSVQADIERWAVLNR